MEFVYVVENNLTDEICDAIIQQFEEERENQITTSILSKI